MWKCILRVMWNIHEIIYTLASVQSHIKSLVSTVPATIYKVSEDIIVNEGSNVTLSCLASGRPDPLITWRLLNPSGKKHANIAHYFGYFVQVSHRLWDRFCHYIPLMFSFLPDPRYASTVWNTVSKSRNIDFTMWSAVRNIFCILQTSSVLFFQWNVSDKDNLSKYEKIYIFLNK